MQTCTQKILLSTLAIIALIAQPSLTSCACPPILQGRITVTGLVDREKGDSYTLTVLADDGGPKRGSTVVKMFPISPYTHTLTATHSF